MDVPWGESPINIVVDVGHTKNPAAGLFVLMALHKHYKSALSHYRPAEQQLLFLDPLFFTKCPIVNALAITEFTSIRNIRISIFKNFRHFT